MNKKSFIWMAVVIIALVGLIFWGAKGAAEINPPFELTSIHPLDNVEGNASSSVLLIEYSDFECPACRTYYPILKQLMVEFGGKIAFVYRNFPLIEIHANADFAARAAQAAAKQGKFWEMHDLLFEKQAEWESVTNVEPLFESYASLAGISVEQFKADYNSRDIINLVRAERANAIKLKLQGTPSFFINGKQIQNPTSVEAFRTIINDAINGKAL